MLSQEEARLKLDDLTQAIAFEKRYRFINVQGKKKLFSTFIAESLPFLHQLTAETALKPEDTAGALLASLAQKFHHYPYMDIGDRMNAMESLEKFIHGLQEGTAAPRRKTSVRSDRLPSDRTQQLDEIEIQYLKGIGPRLAQLLGQVGIRTVENLLYYFPRKHIDYQNHIKIRELTEGQEVTVLGKITGVEAYNSQNKNITVLSLTVADESGSASASWFYGGRSNPALLATYKSRFVRGAEVMISGRVKWDRYKRRPAIDKPQIEILSYQPEEGSSEDPGLNSLHAGRLVPVYPLTEGLNLRFLRKAIHQALQDYLPQIMDPLPEAFYVRYALIPLQEALFQIHFPETIVRYEQARNRLVFDELFYLQTRLALTRAQYKQNIKGLSLRPVADGYVSQVLQNLPFSLTSAQNRVFEEIKTDLMASEPMYRMLQGDVGSGKTVIALLTLLIGIENGYQGALMAPTEILAEQHYRRFVEFLTPLGLKAGLFVGKTGTKERKRLRQDLLNGQIHLAVGTHALIQEDVEFQNLGIVVVDEQHRFGVRQRTQLKSKGEHCEMLTMTATPIPRSLAMTIHGDLDVSFLDELPPGRTPIQTRLLHPPQLKQGYQLIRQEIAKGRQAYIVFPLIEESETLSAKAATSEAERLQNEVFPDFNIGILHGKLKPDEKDTVMSAFVRGDVQILVSTTVVEVGVDVPNATVMVIENADRFGLAQLHQLRGRVGRGTHQSYCLLVSESRTEETVNRLRILGETENGFVIAEKDLELRGPGEFLGTRQSGLPDFILTDLIRDKAILELARNAAFEVMGDPDFFHAHPELKELIYQKTRQTFQVLGSG